MHWKKDSCNSYIDIVSDLADHDERRRKSLKASVREVNTCLKARPMKRVRDFQKRRFGVAPVLLKFSSSRRNLEKKSGTVEKLIDHEEAGQVNEQVDLMEDELFQVGEMIAFRATDCYSFNLLQVIKEYNIDQITTRTSIKGNFWIPSEENDEDNFITFVSDPRWKNGSMTFAHVLRHQQDRIVSVKMAALPGDSSVKFKMEKEIFEEIEEIANAYEGSIARLQNQYPNELVKDVTDCTSEFDGAKDVLEETTQKVPQQSRRPRRKGKGSNYACIICWLLK